MTFTGPGMFRVLKSFVTPVVRLTIRPQTTQNLLPKSVVFQSCSFSPLFNQKKCFSVSFTRYQDPLTSRQENNKALVVSNKKKQQRKRRTIIDQDDSGSPSSPVRLYNIFLYYDI